MLHSTQDLGQLCIGSVAGLFEWPCILLTPVACYLIYSGVPVCMWQSREC